jgi:phosphotriesterase-related protein
MVDAMPMAAGRGPGRLAEVSDATGVNIVMATGLHTPKYYEALPWIESASTDRLTAWFVADIEQGADGSDHLTGEHVNRTLHRAGVIKVATSHDGMTTRAHRLFEAAAAAAGATGAPILTHCEDGLGALEQVVALTKLGVPLDRVVISHTDKVHDSAYHTALLETGVNLEFDQALRQQDTAVSGTAGLLATQIERGFLAQLTLGTDGARRSLWANLGGSPGLAWMADGYRLVLASVGVGTEAQDALFVHNPARILSTPISESRHRELHTHVTHDPDTKEPV